MDFRKLKENQLDNFLIIYRYNIDGMSYQSKLDEVNKLFTILKKNPLSSYPYSIVDLYISSKINMTPNIRIYGINELSDREKIKELKLNKILYLDENSSNYIERLIRILSYAGLVDYSDIVKVLIGYADYNDIKNICQVNKIFVNFCNNKEFWRMLYEEKYGKEKISSDYEKSFVINELNDAFGSGSRVHIDDNNITISFHDVNEDDIKNIIKGLWTNYSYTSLHLRLTTTTAPKRSKVTGLMWGSTDLINLSSEFVDSLLHAININKNLRKLEIENDVTYSDLDKIKNTFSNNSSLTELTIYNNPMLQPIIDGLKFNKTLKKLELKPTGLSDKLSSSILTSLNDMLKSGTTLTSLDISNAKLDVNGLNKILDGLKLNNMLETLNISKNSLGVNGSELISDYLINNTTLKHLDISENRIWAEGTDIILKALKINKSLIKLDIGGNNIKHNVKGSDVDSIKEIKKFLKGSYSLKLLNLYCNNLIGKDLERITDGLKENNTLVGLNIAFNKIGLLALRKVLKKLKPTVKGVITPKNTTLKFIWASSPDSRNFLTRKTADKKIIKEFENSGIELNLSTVNKI